MLTLSRKDGEAIVINERIRIVVSKSKNGRCVFSIDAPREDIIRREEVPPPIESVIQTPTELVAVS